MRGGFCLDFLRKNKIELILMFISLMFYSLMLVMFVRLLYLRWPILILPMAVGLAMSPIVRWRKQKANYDSKIAKSLYFVSVGLFVLGFICAILPFLLFLMGVDGAGVIGIIGCSILLAHIVSYYLVLYFGYRNA